MVFEFAQDPLSDMKYKEVCFARVSPIGSIHRLPHHNLNAVVFFCWVSVFVYYESVNNHVESLILYFCMH